MKRLGYFLGVGLGLILSAPALSEETQTSDVLEIMGKIKEIHSSLDGMTVTLTGGLGTIIGENIYFQNELGRFRVQFDAGRTARQKIEDCSITIFGNIESQCVFEIDAELLIHKEFSLSEGGEIRLIVYNVR